MAAPPPRPDDSAWIRLLRVTGSLKAAVVLLFFFAAASLVGMYVESKTDAETARKYVYNAVWFNAAFACLWWNIFAATMIRYPWPKRLTGFVITHAGLLLIIVGALITRLFGVEGQMMLAEGEASQVLLQPDREALYVKLPSGQRHELAGHHLKRLNPDRPRQIGNSGWGVEVTEYLMRSRIERGYVRAPAGAPAAEVVLGGAQFGEIPTWLRPADPNLRARRLELGMLTVDTQWLPDADAVERFRTAADQQQSHRGWYDVTEDDAADSLGSIRLRLRDGSEQMIAVADLQQGPVTVHGVTVTLRKVLRNAIVGTGPDGTSALVEEPDQSRGAGPAVEFAVTWDGGAEEHAAFARMPDFHSKKGGHAGGQFRGRAVALGFTPGGTILSRLHGEDGSVTGTIGDLAVGQRLETDWNGITVTVRQFFEAARRHVALVDASGDPPGRGEALPGVRFNLYGPGGMEPVWLQFHGRQSVQHPDGPVQLQWSYGEYPLDFKVRLLDFRKVDYPGTTRAASFESDVRVQDPLRGRDEQVTISMNYPMEHGGVAWWPGSDWSFFQSSYQQPENGREISIFSVAYDPGYAVNMVGSALVIFGIFTMFYLVPYFRPKRKRPSPAGAEAA